MPERFSIVKKGYSPDEVDQYIDALEQVIKSYKDKDNAIKNAIISAQVTADSIVQNAHLEADATRGDVLRQLDAVTQSINSQKEMLKHFQEDYNLMVQTYLRDINERDIAKINTQLNEMVEFIQKLAHVKSVQAEEVATEG